MGMKHNALYDVVGVAVTVALSYADTFTIALVIVRLTQPRLFNLVPVMSMAVDLNDSPHWRRRAHDSSRLCTSVVSSSSVTLRCCDAYERYNRGNAVSGMRMDGDGKRSRR